MTAAEPERGFPVSEFEARCDRAQRAMAEKALSGLLLMTEPEIRYFTGFHTLFWQSPTRPWFLFVPADGKPVAVIPEIGAALMARTWIEDIRTWPAPVPEDDGVSRLFELLAPLAEAGARLGVMKGHETHLRMPLADWERLISGLPGLEVVDATGLVQRLRMVKSPAEIAKMSHICKIGSSTFAAFPEQVGPGMPLDGVFRAFRREALAQGADDAPYLVGGAGQGGYTDVISPPKEAPLAAGDILMLDTGLSWDGYFCDFDRNWALGHANEPAQRAHVALWQATEAGLRAARPGATCRDLHAAMAAVTSELDPGGGDIGRMGHGLGMQLTEQPSIAPFDLTVLEPGMVLTLEPSLTIGGGLMMVHEEDVLITETGPELLTERTPCELPVI